MLALAGCGPLFDPDLVQDRASVPAERLSVGHSLSQTFVPSRDRLSAVEVLLAVYPDGQGDAAGDLALRLRREGSAEDLAVARVAIAGLTHNSYRRLSFPPQVDSRGQRYVLTVESTTLGPGLATVWSSGGDVYAAGASYFDGAPRPGDLAFRGYYDYAAPLLASDLASALGRRGWALLVAVAALLLPGLAIQRLLPRLDLDLAERVGLGLGLSLALPPLLLLGTTLVGLRVGPVAAAAFLVGCAVVGLFPMYVITPVVMSLRQLPGYSPWHECQRYRRGLKPQSNDDSSPPSDHTSAVMALNQLPGYSPRPEGQGYGAAEPKGHGETGAQDGPPPRVRGGMGWGSLAHLPLLRAIRPSLSFRATAGSEESQGGAAHRGGAGDAPHPETPRYGFASARNDSGRAGFPLSEANRAGTAPPPGVHPRSVFGPALGAFLVAAGALVLRLVQARDLALPMWGDPVHHALIADLIAAQGRVPVDYGPLVPAQPFNYHFGFHLQVVLLDWLTGLGSADGVLLVGQLLSALLVFPTYLLASRLVGDRRAGLVAGLVVGLVSVMPAYSVTWSRYPQLAGLAILPGAAYLVVRAISDGSAPCRSRATDDEDAASGSPFPRGEWGQARSVLPRGEADQARSAPAPHLHIRGWRLFLAAAVAAAGLILTHPRVALVYGALLLAWLLVESRGKLAPWLRCGLLALLTAALTAPWLFRLAHSRSGESLVSTSGTPTFDFPLTMLTSGLDRYVLAAALVGVGLGLLARRRAAVILPLWTLVALAMANTRLLGLPFQLMLSNQALAIMLFLPIAVCCGLLVSVLASLARHDRWPDLLGGSSDKGGHAGRAERSKAPRALGTPASLGLTDLAGVPLRLLPVGLLVALGLLGGQSLVGTVNPVCLLATSADVEAIRWVAANTPPDAAFLVNAAPWAYGVYQGTDAGYWIEPLAQRRTSLPPQVYAQAAPEDVARIDSLAAATQPGKLDLVALRPRLLAEGYGYVFVGSKGGTITTDLLERTPGYRLVYTNGAASVFEVAP